MLSTKRNANSASREKISTSISFINCPLCGEKAPRSALAAHQRSCIRRTIASLVTCADGNTNLPSSRAKSHFNGHESDTHACYKCKMHIPTHAYPGHIRSCNSKLPEKPQTAPQTQQFVLPAINLNRNHTVSAPQLVPHVLPPLSQSVRTKIREETSLSRPSSVHRSGLKKAYSEETKRQMIPKKLVKSESFDEMEEDLNQITHDIAVVSPIPEIRPVKKLAPISRQQDALAPPKRLIPEDNRIQCPHCERKFSEEAIERHTTACEKISSKRRTVFNAQIKRIKGTEMEKYFSKNGTQVDPNSKKKVRNYIKLIAKNQKTRSTLAALQQQETNDYVGCPHCARRFQRDTAERHIPFCKEAQERAAFRNQAMSSPVERRKKPDQIKPKSGKIGCSGCGSALGSTARFCGSCGAPNR